MNRLKTLSTHLLHTPKRPHHFYTLSAKMSTLTRSQLNTLATHLRTLYNPSSPLILPNVWDASSALAILSHASGHSRASSARNSILRHRHDARR